MKLSGEQNNDAVLIKHPIFFADVSITDKLSENSIRVEVPQNIWLKEGFEMDDLSECIKNTIDQEPIGFSFSFDMSLDDMCKAVNQIEFEMENKIDTRSELKLIKNELETAIRIVEEYQKDEYVEIERE